MKNITISNSINISVPDLDEFEIDDIRTTLANFKEECCDGNDWEEEPCLDKEISEWTAEDHERHSNWSMTTWGKFDELPLDRLSEQTGNLGDLICAIKKNVTDPKIGHLYDALNALESA